MVDMKPTLRIKEAKGDKKRNQVDQGMLHERRERREDREIRGDTENSLIQALNWGQCGRTPGAKIGVWMDLAC